MKWLVSYRHGVRDPVKHASVEAPDPRCAGRYIADKYPLIAVIIDSVEPDPGFLSSADHNEVQP